MSKFVENQHAHHRKLGEVKVMICYTGDEKYMVHSIVDDSFYHIVNYDDLSTEPFVEPEKSNQFYVGREVFHREYGAVTIMVDYKDDSKYRVYKTGDYSNNYIVHVDDLSLSPFIDRHTEDLQHGFYLVSHDDKVKIGIVYDGAIVVFHTDMTKTIDDYTIYNDGEMKMFQYLGETFAGTNYKTVLNYIIKNELLVKS